MGFKYSKKQCYMLCLLENHESLRMKNTTCTCVMVIFASEIKDPGKYQELEENAQMID